MSVELKDLVVGSVVIDNRGSIGIVVETNHTPTYPIIFAVKASGSRYKGRPTDFRAVIGTVDAKAFLEACRQSIERSEPLFGENPMFLPEPLKGMNLKIGDKIKIRHGFSVVNAVYEGYSYSRPKYPVSYTINGKKWKCPAAAVVSKVV